MSSNHLEYRLPWATLAQIVKLKSKGVKEGNMDTKHVKAIYHFSRCLVDQIKDFAATDRSADAIKRQYDPNTWGIDAVTSSPFDIAYYDSILWGCIELNVLLVDPSAFIPIVLGEHQALTDAMRAMSGTHNRDSNHPAWLATHLAPAIDGRSLKPVTLEVLQLLRDHSGRMFRCMYALLAPHGRIDADFVALTIANRFGFHWDVWNYRVAQAQAAATAST